MKAASIRGPRGPRGLPGVAGGNYLAKRQVFTAPGDSALFTLTFGVPDALKDAAHVFLRGIFRDRVDAAPSGEQEYTLSGTVLTFGASPIAGSRIEIRYWVNP